MQETILNFPLPVELCVILETRAFLFISRLAPLLHRLILLRIRLLIKHTNLYIIKLHTFHINMRGGGLMVFRGAIVARRLGGRTK